MRERPFRPGFDHTVEAAPADVDRVLAALLDGDRALSGRARTGNLMLSVRDDERHFWSPWLHLQIVPHRVAPSAAGSSRSYVSGFFTPHPSLWTLFVMAYLTSAVTTFFAAIWGLVQLQLDHRPWALGVCLVSAFAAGALWLVSRVGRLHSADQMEALHATVDETLARAGAVSAGSGSEAVAAAGG